MLCDSQNDNEGTGTFVQSVHSVCSPVQGSGFQVQDSRFKVAAGKNLQMKDFSSLNFLHHATQQAVLCPATGDNADISHFFFFFIVC